MLKELLPDWDGVMVCDGWHPYKMFNVQRCGAHIIREVEFIAKRDNTPEARRVLRVLRQIYDDAKGACKMSKKKRQKLYGLLCRRIRNMVKTYRKNKILKKFMTKPNNAGTDLFRFS